MTTPDIFATGYTASAEAFLNAPTGQGDSPRLVIRTAAVADSASVGTVYGLVPFNKGARVHYNGVIAHDQLDTATLMTVDVGYVYDDNDTVTNINDPDAFVDGSTGPRAAGVIEFNAPAGATFEATDDGWIVLTIAAGGSATQAGNITFNGMISYQG